jgi:hypothetical protein
MVAGWIYADNVIKWVGDMIGGVWVDGAMMMSLDASFIPRSLAYSTLLHGVLTKEFREQEGRVVLLADAWYSSLRCAWISACI